jgi:uncharacterized protein (TIGR02594 family)
MLTSLIPGLELLPPDDESPWMRVAAEELGQRELHGQRHNRRIVDYLRAVGLSGGDETPWCSAFANWCLQRVGMVGSGRANARSWLAWGQPLGITEARYGCITVLRRTSNPARGHVGFWVGTRAGRVLLLGGNQLNSVCVRGYPLDRVLGFRWPLLGPARTPWG